MTDYLILATIVGLVVVSALGALATTAIERMNRVRAHHLVQEKRRGAKALLEIVEDPAPYLNVVMLVTLGAYVTATALAADRAIERFGHAGTAVAAGVMTVLVFVFALLVPRTFTVQRTDSAALAMAVPVVLVSKVMKPLARILLAIANATMLLLPGRALPKGPFVTEDEIRHLVNVAEEEEEIEEEERELIHSVFEFGDTRVREVMVPRPDMVTIRADATLSQALDMIIKAGYSRIPIYDGEIDNVIEVLYAKDLLKRLHEGKADAKVTALGRAPLFVPETKKVAELLREMQTQHVHMAIVIDEYGGTAGVVTIEDLIEEIVGEIIDEYDREEPLVEPVDDHTIRVDAKMAIDEVNELLDVELPHEEWDTVGGLVFGLTGRVPEAGETVKYDSLEFRTERVSGRRIQKVVIRKLQNEPTAEGD